MTESVNMAGYDGLVDVDALQAWLADHVKGDPPLTMERMGEATGVGQRPVRRALG